MFPEWFLSVLRCPESRQPLHEADPRLVGELNSRAAAGSLRNRAGKPVQEPLDGALVRADGQLLFPVRKDVPLVVMEEAIPLPLP